MFENDPIREIGPREAELAAVFPGGIAAAVWLLRDALGADERSLADASALGFALLGRIVRHTRLHGHRGLPQFDLRYSFACDAALWLLSRTAGLEQARAMLASPPADHPLTPEGKARILELAELPPDGRALLEALLSHDDARWESVVDATEGGETFGRLVCRSGGMTFDIAWIQTSSGRAVSVAALEEGERHLLVRPHEMRRSRAHRALYSFGMRLSEAYEDAYQPDTFDPERGIDANWEALLGDASASEWRRIRVPCCSSRIGLAEALRAGGRELPLSTTPNQRVLAAAGPLDPIRATLPIDGRPRSVVIAPLVDGRALAVSDNNLACLATPADAGSECTWDHPDLLVPHVRDRDALRDSLVARDLVTEQVAAALEPAALVRIADRRATVHETDGGAVIATRPDGTLVRILPCGCVSADLRLHGWRLPTRIGSGDDGPEDDDLDAYMGDHY